MDGSRAANSSDLETFSVARESDVRRITEAEANSVYSALIQLAGARDDAYLRYAFVHHACEGTEEYSFQGKLGFGGKFRNDGNMDGVPHIDCYPEDATEEHLRTINNVNAVLAAMFRASENSVPLSDIIP